MKNVVKTLAVTAVMVSATGGVAFADVVCNGSISTTGTGSTNTVTCTDVENNNVSCVNNIVVKANNNQGASSGGAFVTGNTTGGDAESGEAENENNTVVEVGASCAPYVEEVAVVTPTTPTTPSTPQVLGQGAGAAQVAVKPVGAAAAGAGAGVATNEVAAATALVASAGLVGFGLTLRKRVLGN